ncbi:zinc finger, c3HC4 type (RING finger) domain-containing protein [Ditylenchus destructor]|nr:zinc finger, c3HC4 type (RING finger) domain-containing protein [Ditylenchus destructor]
MACWPINHETSGVPAGLPDLDTSLLGPDFPKQQSNYYASRDITQILDYHLECGDQKLLERFRRDPEEPNAEDRCCICYVRRASVRAYPCGHQVFCRMCGVSLIQSLFESKQGMMRCVLCRSEIAVLRHQKTGKLTSLKDLNPSKMTEQPARLWPWHWN